MDCCRVCLADEADVFMSLFSKSEQVSIAEMVNELTGLKISKGDGLPRFICKECSEEIQKCYRVRLKCLESDKKLRHTLEKTHQKIRIVEFYLQQEIHRGETSCAGKTPDSISAEVLNNVVRDDKLMEMLSSKDPVDVPVGPDSTAVAETASEDVEPLSPSNICIKQENSIDLIIKLDDKEEGTENKILEEEVEALEEVAAASFVEEESTSNLNASSTENEEACSTSNQNMVEEELEYSEVYLDMTDDSPEGAQYNIVTEGEDDVEDDTIVGKAESEHSQEGNAGKSICCGCQMVFSSNAELAQHSNDEHGKMRLKHSAKPFECDVCFKRFLSEARLLIHKNDVYREKNHVCDMCNARFSCRGSLLNHKKTHAERTYFCEDCDKSFHTCSTLKSHRLLHTNNKQYKCLAENCDKTFRRISDLHIHLVSHSDERPFECETCSRRFKSKAHLVHHGKVHTKEKPYKCNKCDKAFGTYSARKFHQFGHEGIHPYKCIYCDKTYQRNAKLQVHIRRIHTGERPFACDMCDDARFYQNSELTAHKRQFHNLDINNERTQKEAEGEEDEDVEMEDE
ncbi:zinc finger protein 98-like [Armigeres subalbatus]|uniref:zinc finger protein 98-like n=1 Tax=Armigeres subalbatus TaxID=124917 RepID=UPI002ED3AC2D